MSETTKQTVVTPTGQIVFTNNVFKPNDDGKFSATLLLNKSQDVSKLKAIMMEAAKQKFSEDQIKSKKMNWSGLKVADEDSQETYDFMDDETLILNASTKFEIEVKSSEKDNKGKYIDLVEGDLVAGDYCRFLVSAYPWEYQKKYGVSFNVIAIQKVKDCEEPLYSRPSSDSTFDEAEFDMQPETSERAFETEAEEATSVMDF